MDFLLDAKDMYDTITADKSGNVWVTVYPVPGGKESCLYAGEGEAGEIWQMVEKVIQNNLKYSKRFRIRVAMPTKEGSSAKNAMPQTINVSYEPAMQGQVTGIGNLREYQSQETIGAIEKRLEEKFEERMKHERELRDLKDEIAGLKYENQQKKKKGDWVDKLEVIAGTTGLDLSNPQSIQAVSGLVMGALDKVLGAFTRHPQPTPAMAGTRQPQRGRTQVHRFETDETVPPPTEAMTEPDETELTELTEQEEMALDALDILTQAGAENPGELLVRVATYYRNNPEQAKGLLNFL